MDKIIMVGCDLHDKSMLLKIDVFGKVLLRSWENRRQERKRMMADLQGRAQAAGADRIVFAYEASGLGFGLWDELTAAGIECYVLAPTGMACARKHRQQKTDAKDAQRVLEHLRAHLLAGNELANVWVPDKQTRDDRELTRLRLELGEKLTVVKAQIRCLLKRNGVEWHEAPIKGWTSGYITWLTGLCGGRLGPGASAALASLLRQLRGIEQETHELDKGIAALGQSPRYQPAVQAMRRDKGVGLLTAMVFLTELGDLSRFANRRQVGAYLGLSPSSHESGDVKDRKGHITRRGPGRVRKVLNQAVWSRIRSDPSEKEHYDRIAAKNPKHKKIAVVAAMRRMAVRCWHNGLEAQLAGGAQLPAARVSRVLPPAGDPPSAAPGTDGPKPRRNFREFFGMTPVSPPASIPPNKDAANSAAEDPRMPRRCQLVPPPALGLHGDKTSKRPR